MNVVLWIAQGLFAAFFLMVGSNHLFKSWEALIKELPAMASLPQGFVRFLGVCELLGVVGLILPAIALQTHVGTGISSTLTTIMPWLVVAAASGFSIQMFSAVVFHIQRKEYNQIGFPLVLFLFALFIVIGRWIISPLG